MKFGMAKNERLTMSSRRIVNQQRDSVISYCALKEILKRTLEQLRVYPERIEDGPS